LTAHLLKTRYRIITLAVLAGCALAACTSAPTPAVPAAEPPTPEPAVEAPTYSNTLRWTTASEVDNFGFDVYRGDSEDGPFERLTENPISGAGTTDLTTQYSFEDKDIDPYRVYFYYVESISLQGVREQFTPIIEAKAKLPASASAVGEPADGGEG
jgi:hypothetical protein